MENRRFCFILSHPRGIGTYNYRLLSFVKVFLKYGYDQIVIPDLKYPFSTQYAFPGNLDLNKFYKNISIEYTNIQKLVSFLERKSSKNFFKRFLYMINILVSRKDLWYLPIGKSDFLTKEFAGRDTFIASGGPGGVFEMAYELASQDKNSVLILDYRDPWNFGYTLLGTNYVIQRIRRYFLINRELRILERANHITIVSESLKQLLPQKFHHKVSIVENGSNYDQKDILNDINHKPDIFNIVYVGTIYAEQLVNESFFIAFQNFLNSIQNSKNVRLKFIGSNRNKNLKNILNKYKLEQISEVTERIGVDQLKPYLLNASMFIHFKYGANNKIVTSKNSDYLLFRKPILLPSSDNGDLENSILLNQAGYVCGSVEEIANALNIEFNKFLQKSKISINMDKDFSHLTRSKIAEKFLDIVNKTLKE